MTALLTEPVAGPLGDLFAREFSESAYEVTGVEGGLPGYLRGTYYINGPALFGRAGQRDRNWLDGDGMVCALSLDGEGGARFANRFVRTRKFVAEQEAGRPLFRTFGTAFPGDRLRRGLATESPANVSVLPFAGRLLACGEQSLPYALDPVSLETLGVYDFGGALNEISPFSAHPKVDPVSGELLNFGVWFSSKAPKLDYYRFDASGGLALRSRVPLDAPCSIHDFAVSRRFVIIHLGPYVLDVDGLIGEGRATIDALRWCPDRGSRLLILDRDSGDELARLAVETRYSLHTIRAFEDGDRLIVDLIEYDGPLYPEYQPFPLLYSNVPDGMPARYVVDTKRWRIGARRVIDYREAPDFPCIDPRVGHEEDFWTLGISTAGREGPKFFDRLARLSWKDGAAADAYVPPDGRYLGSEPAIVPDPDDASGASVVCHEFDPRAGASWFVVLDARDLARGPVARLPLDSPIPPGFHSTFCEEGVFGPRPEGRSA